MLPFFLVASFVIINFYFKKRRFFGPFISYRKQTRALKVHAQVVCGHLGYIIYLNSIPNLKTLSPSAWFKWILTTCSRARKNFEIDYEVPIWELPIYQRDWQKLIASSIIMDSIGVRCITVAKKLLLLLL